MSTNLVVQNPSEDVFAVGKAMFASGLFPDLKKEAAAVVKILAGREFGIGPVAALSGIHIIDGKPSAGSGLLAGLVKASAKYDYQVNRLDTDGCELEFFELLPKRRSVGVSVFGKAEAIAAQLAGRANYKKHPLDMFFARALTAGVRRFCPDVINGLVAYTPDELGADVDPERSEPVQATAAVASPVAAADEEVVTGEVVEEAKPAPKASRQAPSEAHANPKPKPAADREAAGEPEPAPAAKVATPTADAPDVDPETISPKALVALWKETGQSMDFLAMSIVGVGYTEPLADGEGVADRTLITTALKGLTLDQAIALREDLKRASGDDGIPGAGS